MSSTQEAGDIFGEGSGPGMFPKNVKNSTARPFSLFLHHVASPNDASISHSLDCQCRTLGNECIFLSIIPH